MSSILKIELSPQAQRLVGALPALPQKLAARIAQVMDQENLVTVSHIQRAHLTGVGPFPVEEHKLGMRTSRLRTSANASEATVSGDLIISAIGSNVKYAAVHEFGGRIHHPAREVKVRLRTDARGNLVRQLKNSNLAMFAGAHHKRVKEVTSQAKAYDVDMPERSPFRTGIKERSASYGKAFSAAIVGEWNKLSN